MFRRFQLIFRFITGAVIATSIYVGPQVSAISPTSFYIKAVQPGVSTAAGNEYIVLSNAGDVELALSGWKLQYVSASGNTTTDVLELNGSVAAHGTILIANAVYNSLTHPLTNIDQTFDLSSSVLAVSGGFIQLVNVHSTLQDCVGWGSAVSRQGCDRTSSSLKADFSYQRSFLGEVSSLTLTSEGSVSGGGFTPAPPIIIDVCQNLEGIQTSVPTGYSVDDSGNCVVPEVDVCVNIPGTQSQLPDDMQLDTQNNCVPIPLPVEYLPIRLSELLPDPGSPKLDANDEYIELYNPNEVPVDVGGYRIMSGANLSAAYTLSAYVIPAHGYLTLYSSETHVGLSNNGTSLQLQTPDRQSLGEVVSYGPVATDQAWAFIDGSWQLTDKPTPDVANEFYIQAEGEVESAVTGLAPCPAGKYRNPLTNRCRTIASDVAVLGACDGDEYRNPETNRCRKINSVVSSLSPCREGYERNPETNRCRKIADESTALKPCEAGQERNPLTNRCRKVLTDSAQPAETIASVPTASSPLGWALGIALVGVAGYGAYEWRSEIAKGFGALRRKLSNK